MPPGTDHAGEVIAEAVLSHVAHRPPGAPGRTIVLITLTGGSDALREALGDQVVAAAQAALAPPPVANPLAAVFAQLAQPAPPPRAAPAPAPAPAPPPPAASVALPVPVLAQPRQAHEIVAAVLPSRIDLIPAPGPAFPPVAPLQPSPYEAPFVLAPLGRPADHPGG